MSGKGGLIVPVLVVLAMIGGLALVAAVSRELWLRVVMGGPLIVSIAIAAAFLLGVVIGSMRSR